MTPAPDTPPTTPEQLAEALMQEGRLEEAERIYRNLIAAGTATANAYANLAAICGRTGRLEELRPLLDEALRLRPDHPEAQNYLGIVLQEQGDWDAAVAAYRTAIEHAPDYPDAYNNLGNALQQQGNRAAAIQAYSRALELLPDYPEARSNLGLCLQELGELEAAIDCFHRSIELNPQAAEPHFNLGVARRLQGDLQGAIAAYDECLRLRPEDQEARHNRAMALLSVGDYAAGWDEYEHRFACRQGRTFLCARPAGPRWQGEPLAAGEELLLISEQGLGDTLQFMRYALVLRRRGLAVRLCAPVGLHGLVVRSGIDASPLTPEQVDGRATGPWIPLLSVPRLLGVRPDAPLLTEPYIRVGEERIRPWRELLSSERRPVIAIHWQGNPQAETTSLRGRSLPLEAFRPIAQRCQATLLSLQKGFGSEQRACCTFSSRFVRCQAEIDASGDFEDTAALIACSDLLITSDTCVAHLAGGMGQPTWLLLHALPDWRWGLEGESSFWYPSMRLIRQRRPGDWAEMMERVAGELEALVQLTTLLGAADG